MKKVYLLASLIIGSSSLFAQDVKEKDQSTMRVDKNGANLVAPMKASPKFSSRGVIWSDDFSNGANWTMFDGPAGTQGDFEIITMTPVTGNQFPDIDQGEAMFPMEDPTNPTMPSAGNGFANFNGTQYLLPTAMAAPQDAVIEYQGPAIDMSMSTGAIISFKQNYRPFNTDEQYIEISSDNGLNYTSFLLNDDYFSNDPTYAEEITINISDLHNQTSDLKVRFRWKNTDTDPSSGSGYGWSIDDVTISDASDEDLEIVDLFFQKSQTFPSEFSGNVNISYAETPIEQVSAMQFMGSARNMGGLTTNGSEVVVTIKDHPGYSTTSFDDTVRMSKSGNNMLAVPETDTFFDNSKTFTPMASGSFGAIYKANHDDIATDGTPMNNVDSTLFGVNTSGFYTRSTNRLVRGMQAGQNCGVSQEEPCAFEWGLIYQIINAEKINAVGVTLYPQTEPGAEIYAAVYSIDPVTNDRTLIASTDNQPHVVQPGDISSSSNIVQVVLELDQSYDIPAGTNLLVAVGFIASGPEQLWLGSDGSIAEPSTVYLFTSTSSSIFTMGRKPSISLYTQASGVGIDETVENNISLSQNYPNPFSDESLITYELNEATKVSFQVTDVTGKVVYTTDMGKQTRGAHNISIDAKQFNSGVYYYTLTAGLDQVTKKMIINK